MSSAKIRTTRNRLNAFLWAKQGLADRKGRPLTEVASCNFGLYGTAPTCYLSLLVRVPGFRVSDLDRETVTKRSLVRLRAMRASQFLVPASDLPMTWQATKDLPQADFGKILGQHGVTEDVYLQTAERVEELVAAAPRTATELRREIDPSSESLRQAFSFLVAEMCRRGRLVRGQVRGTWRSDRFEYALMSDWLPDADLDSVRPGEARQQLARRYFATYGPATAEDFRWWSGLTKGLTARTLQALGDELAEVDVLGLRGTYLALARESSKIEGRSRPSAQGLALLPVWDAYLMAYASRDRYLDREWAGRIVDVSGNVTSVVFWKGRVAGVWDFDELERRLRVKVAPLADLSHAAWKAIRQVTQRIARAIGKREVIVERCPPPRPLSEGTRNQFLSPLKGVSGTPV